MQFVTFYAVSSFTGRETYIHVGIPPIEVPTRSQTSIDPLYTPVTPLYHLRVNTHLCAALAHASSAALPTVTCDLATLHP